MRKFWIAFALVLVVSFSILGWTGVRIYQQAPPVPERVVTSDGQVLIGPGEIHRGHSGYEYLDLGQAFQIALLAGLFLWLFLLLRAIWPATARPRPRSERGT